MERTARTLCPGPAFDRLLPYNQKNFSRVSLHSTASQRHAHAVSRLLRRPLGTPSPVARLRSPSSGGELTADHLDRAESAGAASILEVWKPLKWSLEGTLR